MPGFQKVTEPRLNGAWSICVLFFCEAPSTNTNTKNQDQKGPGHRFQKIYSIQAPNTRGSQSKQIPPFALTLPITHAKCQNFSPKRLKPERSWPLLSKNVHITHPRSYHNKYCKREQLSFLLSGGIGVSSPDQKDCLCFYTDRVFANFFLFWPEFNVKVLRGLGFYQSTSVDIVDPVLTPWPLSSNVHRIHTCQVPSPSYLYWQQVPPNDPIGFFRAVRYSGETDVI